MESFAIEAIVSLATVACSVEFVDWASMSPSEKTVEIASAGLCVNGGVGSDAFGPQPKTIEINAMVEKHLNSLGMCIDWFDSIVDGGVSAICEL